MAKYRTVRISVAEHRALHNAVDFITTNIDGATDEQYKFHSRYVAKLNQIIRKYKKAPTSK